MIRVGADMSAFNTAMGTIGPRLDQARADAEAAWAPIATLGTSLMGVGAGLTAAITVPLGALATAAVSAAGEMQSLMAGLTAVAGSSEAAKVQMERLKEVAKLPGLGLEEAVQGSIRLQAVGVSAQEAEREMKAFGNALATVGKGRADLEAVITQLVQMSSKTKVVAEDLKPIMERVPQVATIVKEAFGTIDTEVIQKMGVTTKDFVATIITGLEKLPPVAGGIKNSFENVSDAMQQSLAKVGNAFIPIITAAAPYVEAFIVSIGDLGDKFTQLPAPIQNGVLAFGAVLTAIGPVTLAIGGVAAAIGLLMPLVAPLATAVGLGTAAFLGWAAAIPVVVGALVALGTWVDANWEPIKATVLQAWDGIKEMWTAAFGWAVPFITGVWDTISGATTKAWNYIGGFLSGLWEGILKTANTVWGGIVSVFQTFLEWAGKIPGVNKLMNLDDAWKSAQKLQEETKKAADAVKAHGDAHTKAAPKVKTNTAAVAAHTTKLTEAEKAAKRYADANASMVARYEKEAADYVRAATKLNDVTALLDKSNLDLEITFGRVHERMRAESLKTVEIIVPLTQRIPAAVQEAVKANQQLEAAYKSLGITSSKELSQHADNAREAYETIKNSGTATARDLDAAWVKYEEARIEAAKAAGQQIPAETDRALAKVKDSLGIHTQQTKDTWSDWSKQVSTIVTDLGRDLSRVLFDGDKSWGEKGKAMLESLGQAVTRMFVEPATKALGDLMSGVLSDLIGGKGFGGVVDSVKNAGKAISDIFGGGGGATSAAGGAPGGIPGGGAGGAGGAAGGAGVMGTVGVVAGVATAISSVIGNFQNAHQETSLNAIEHNTRYSMEYLGERSDGGILGQMFRVATLLEFGVIVQAAERTRDLLGDHLPGMWEMLSDVNQRMQFAVTRLDQIGHNVLYGSEADESQTRVLLEIRDAIRDRGNRSNVTISVNGAANPQAVGDDIMRQLRLQGVFA